jgi:uncharacterized protein
VLLAPETLVLLFMVAALAGCLDAIAGGGGLLTVPALLLAGLDPASAIATNKVQSIFGTASATTAFARAGKIDWHAAWPMALMSAAASAAGASVVKLVPASILLLAMPLLLMAVALYFALSGSIGRADAPARLSPALFTVLPVPAIAFYDGFFGPGAGSFFMLALVSLLGFGALRAIAHTKLLNFSSNAGSLGIFIATGLVVWPVGLTMALGSLLGAQLGSRLALRHGAWLARPLLVATSCAIAVKLLLDGASPWPALWRDLAG